MWRAAPLRHGRYLSSLGLASLGHEWENWPIIKENVKTPFTTRAARNTAESTLGIFLAHSWRPTSMCGSFLQWGPKGTAHTQICSQEISTISPWMGWNPISAKSGRKTTAALIERQLFQGNSYSKFCLFVTWPCYLNCHIFIKFNEMKLSHLFMSFIFVFERIVMWCKISLWKKGHNGTQNTKIHFC